jgi:hypothetical protein
MYTLVATTYEPSQLAAFVVKVFSSHPLQHLRSISPEGDGMAATVLKCEWGAATGAGCTNCGRYTSNPVFRVVVAQRGLLIARLELPSAAAAEAEAKGGRASSSVALNLSLFAALPGGLSRLASPSAPPGSEGAPRATSNRGVYAHANCGVAISATLEPGAYLVVPSTFEPWQGRFKLTVYTNPAVPVVTQLQ